MRVKINKIAIIEKLFLKENCCKTIAKELGYIESQVSKVINEYINSGGFVVMPSKINR